MSSTYSDPATPLAGAATVESDAIVVGGGIGGLVLAYLLSGYGYAVRLVEKSPWLGGFDRSFTNDHGKVFDLGMHALDHMRSEFTTKLFEEVVDGRAHLVEKKRGIVLRNHVIPYNARLEDWPAELREMLPEGGVVDDLGDRPPTRENLARIYGRRFVDLIFDEALASYPAEHRHLAFGVEEHRLASGLYPWYFPRVARTRADVNESRRYQDLVRETPKEYVLYPDEGGFGTFIDAFRQKLEARGVVLSVGAPDLTFDVDPETHECRSIQVNGERWTAPKVYWTAPAAVLCDLLGLPCHDTRPDRFVLTSFQFERPLDCDRLELILADPTHRINRISFPGKLNLGPDDQAQLEFAFPRDSELSELAPDAWYESGLDSLRRLGIAQPDNEVVDFDHKTVLTFYNAFGIDGRPMPEVDLSELRPGSNVRPVVPTIRKVNINTRMPQFLRFLAEDLTRV